MIQLAHAGRKASSHTPWDGGQLIPVAEGGWRAEGPSAIPHKGGETPPLAFDAAGLKRVRDAFVAATKRAERLGIDAIEVHSAHGYLLHQFLSRRQPAHRSIWRLLENRMRFPLEVFDAVRAAFPHDKPVGIRVSSTDWVEGGWDLAQTIEFARELKGRGVDWIDASRAACRRCKRFRSAPASGAVRAGDPRGDRACHHRRRSDHGTGAGRGDRGRGKADMVALARGMLYDPRWGWHAAAELGGEVFAPPQYWRSQPSTQKTLFGATTFGTR